MSFDKNQHLKEVLDAHKMCHVKDLLDIVKRCRDEIKSRENLETRM